MLKNKKVHDTWYLFLGNDDSVVYVLIILLIILRNSSIHSNKKNNNTINLLDFALEELSDCC